MSHPPRIEVEDALAQLEGWSAAKAGKPAIFRTYRFASFGDAFTFMSRMALLAERMDHHPDWRNTYKQVKVLLTTHSRGGLTQLDVDMAKAMDEAAARLGAS